MSFERTFVAVSYGLVSVAFLAVALSGELGWITPGLFAAALLGSLLRRPEGPPRPLTARIWTGALVAASLLLVLWALRDGNWLLHALEFALLMTASRLFQRRFAKDYLQMYALSFLLMLVAAVIHPSLTFAVSFILYAVLAIWALTILHLVREIEVQTRTGPEHLLPPEERYTRWLPWNWRRKPAPPDPESLPDSPVSAETLRWRRRRLIGGAFLAASSLMALVVLGASMVFFFLFPRLGMGFFRARTRGSQSVVGFSDQVRLGGFGKLKTSARVVMRVTFPEDADRLERPLRVRGVSFDRYDMRSHSWQRLDDPEWVLLHRGDRYAIPQTPAPRPGVERTFLSRIYLEPLSSGNKVLFAPPRPRWVQFIGSEYDVLRGRRKRVARSLGGDLSFRAPADTALVYEVSAIEPISGAKRAERLHRVRGGPPRWVRDRWTSLPPDLDPRIAALADELVGDARGLYGEARAIESGLQHGWTYSLEGGQNPEAPLVDFLFGVKRGHCEYFASAMVLMMRARGHAARLVNGFSGGEYNGFGHYRMIRQADAHSWVEVFFPGVGWQTFDPTPPAGQLAPVQGGAVAALRRMIDGASMLWYTWIVEYDLERQVAVFRELARKLRRVGRGLKSHGAAHRDGYERRGRGRESAGTTAKVPDWLPRALLLAALFLWLRWLLAKRRRVEGRRPDPGLAAAISRLDRRLRRLGVERRRWETWRLVGDRMASLDRGSSEAIATFARLYDEVRFAPEPDPARVAGATRAARRAEALVRAVPAPPREAA